MNVCMYLCAYLVPEPMQQVRHRRARRLVGLEENDLVRCHAPAAGGRQDASPLQRVLLRGVCRALERWEWGVGRFVIMLVITVSAVVAVNAVVAVAVAVLVAEVVVVVVGVATAALMWRLPQRRRQPENLPLLHRELLLRDDALHQHLVRLPELRRHPQLLQRHALAGSAAAAEFVAQLHARQQSTQKEQHGPPNLEHHMPIGRTTAGRPLCFQPRRGGMLLLLRPRARSHVVVPLAVGLRSPITPARPEGLAGRRVKHPNGTCASSRSLFTLR
jgi:hypothetical protein